MTYVSRFLASILTSDQHLQWVPQGNILITNVSQFSSIEEQVYVLYIQIYFWEEKVEVHEYSCSTCELEHLWGRIQHYDKVIASVQAFLQHITVAQPKICT